MKLEGNTQAVIKLLSLKSQLFRRVVEATEKTAVRMAAHAKAGHEKGSDPHSRNRYENQTSNLTNSISPGGPGEQGMQWESVTDDKIVGLFGIMETTALPGVEYGPYVEERYPFIWPAAVAHIGTFQKEVAKAAKGTK